MGLAGYQDSRELLDIFEAPRQIAGASLLQTFRMTGPNMRCREQIDNRHACGNAGLDAADAVFNDDASRGIHGHRFRGIQEDIGVWFAALDLGGAEHIRAKEVREIEDVKTKGEAVARRR